MSSLVPLNNSHPSNTPLISLIVPVYNIESYLTDCLESIVGQSYSNLEIILVDDGSEDRSSTICDEYATMDSRIKVFHRENRGLSAARNIGLDNMSRKAEFVMFLDGDDWMELNTIETLYNKAEKNHADIAVCQFYSESNVERVISYEIDKQVLLSGNQIMESFLTDGFIGNFAWNKLYRSGLFSSIRYPVGMVFEDIATTYKLLTDAQTVVVIPEPLIHYRIRENSLSRKDTILCRINYWEAYYMQYNDLSGLLLDKSCLQKLIGNCLVAINRMYRSYGGYSKEDQKYADRTIVEMKRFASEHRKAVLSDQGFTILQKFTCICVAMKNPAYMWSLNRFYKTYFYFKYRKT